MDATSGPIVGAIAARKPKQARDAMAAHLTHVREAALKSRREAA